MRQAAGNEGYGVCTKRNEQKHQQHEQPMKALFLPSQRRNQRGQTQRENRKRRERRPSGVDGFGRKKVSQRRDICFSEQRQNRGVAQIADVGNTVVGISYVYLRKAHGQLGKERVEQKPRQQNEQRLKAASDQRRQRVAIQRAVNQQHQKQQNRRLQIALV